MAFKSLPLLWLLGVSFAWLLAVSSVCSCHAQGIIVSAAGPVNRGMGGASTAAPTDALGSLYWNPATISGMASSQTDFGLDVLVANQTVRSSAGGVQGSTDAEAGAFPIPNVGWVHRVADSPLTLGLGLNAIAGFKTNLLSDPSNPVLAPAPTGLGRVSSEASFLQLAPVISYALTESVAVAAGPTLTTGQIGVEPFVFDTPNPHGYPAGRSTRYHWGAGFQLGTYYIYSPNVRFGASFKSPTWMEQFEFYGADASGGPRILTADIDLPMILSVGTSYTDNDRWLFAFDARFIDYANTQGLGDPAEFDASGRLAGLGWSSVFATALGAQYQASESLALRSGYTFNQNPISDSEAFFNVASPLIYQHMLSSGLSLRIFDATSVNAAYSYMFENTRSGAIHAPGVGALVGTAVENSMSAHFFSFGMSIYQ